MVINHESGNNLSVADIYPLNPTKIYTRQRACCCGNGGGSGTSDSELREGPTLFCLVLGTVTYRKPISNTPLQ